MVIRNNIPAAEIERVNQIRSQAFINHFPEEKFNSKLTFSPHSY